MRPLRLQPRTYPKISTMPRPQTEAAAYLELYKLVTEQKRLEQELESLEQRRDRILNRLEELNIHIAAKETTVHQLRGQPPLPAPAKHSVPTPVTASSFNTVLLEY